MRRYIRLLLNFIRRIINIDKGKIFISYRRSVSTWQALSVYYALQEVYKKVVFVDLMSLGSGDFEKYILHSIDSCRHFIIILAPGTLDNCQKKDDWVTREIKRAIENEKNIVPLFFEDFKFDIEKENLKKSGLEKLQSYSGLKIEPTLFKECMEKLTNKFLKGHEKISEPSLPESLKESINPDLFVPLLPISEPLNVQPVSHTSYIKSSLNYWGVSQREKNSLLIKAILNAVEMGMKNEDLEKFTNMKINQIDRLLIPETLEKTRIRYRPNIEELNYISRVQKVRDKIRFKTNG